MGQWWLMGRDRVPVGPVTTELVLKGIQAGKVPNDALACEVGASAWRSVRSVSRFAPAFAKLRIDGPTLVDLASDMMDDPPTLANATLRPFDDREDPTVADAREVDDIVPTQRLEEATEVTIVDRVARLSEPPH
jgi:hypothetical protein